MFCIYDSSSWYYFAFGLPAKKKQNRFYIWLVVSSLCPGLLWEVSEEDLANYKELKN